jgi:hypothetical protein
MYMRIVLALSLSLDVYILSVHALAFATGCHALYLCFVVLYGLYADLLSDRTGLCSFGSHVRMPCELIGSAFGALSTMYEIHACLFVSLEERRQGAAS